MALDPDRSFTLHITMSGLSFTARVPDEGLSGEALHALRNVVDSMRGLTLWLDRKE